MTTASISTVAIKSSDQYLTHYWPISNGKGLDEIGSANMLPASGLTFVEDRFCNKNLALSLNGGWTYIPRGIYFDSPEFTIAVWVYPQQIGKNSRVIDFGNFASSDNIIFGLSMSDSLQPFVLSSISSQFLSLNQWQFLVGTFNGTNERFYLNGQ